MIYIIFYPGGFSADSTDQYAQAAGINHYNDWHPVLHTLLAFSLPLKVSGGWLGSIVLLQIILFSMSLAYMFLTLIEYSNAKYTRIWLVYTLISPATLGISICMYKDVWFAIAAILLMSFAVRIHFSGGRWLKDIKNAAVFTVVLSACTIFRHNAILFTLPMLAGIMLYAERRARVFIVCGFAALLFLVRGILYPALNVEKPGYRQFEMLGIPLAVIHNAAQQTSELLDNDILKFSRRANRDFVEQTGWAKVLDMAFRCLKKSTWVSVKTIADITDLVYGISGVFIGGCMPYIVENSWGITDKGIYFLERLFYAYGYGSMMLLKHVFWHLGIANIIIIILALAKLRLKRLSDLKILCLVLPVFVYNYGTMLLLKINDFRFFYYTWPVLPLVILMLTKEKQHSE